MLVETNGPKWFDRRRPEPSGPSVLISLCITVALFASAFAAMRRIAPLAARADERDPTIVVRLAPPPATPRQPPRPLEPPRTTSAPAATPPVVQQPTASAPIAPPATVAPAPADTGARSPLRAPAAIPLGVAPPASGLADTAMGARGGAPLAPSGVTIGSRVENTARFRDSISNARQRAGVGSWMAHEATGAERAQLESWQHDAARLNLRATTAGNGAEVHSMQGMGNGGAGAVGGAGSKTGVGLPLFSSGRSAAQRKKNERIDAEYQLRLRRLEDRILLRRDSVRADSLRRDSIARGLRKP